MQKRLSAHHKHYCGGWFFFALNNLSEFVVVARFFENDETDLILLKLYYVALFFALAYMCIFVRSLGNQTKLNKVDAFILSIALLLCIITILTNWIIADSESLGYTVTAVKGGYYFIFQLTVLFAFAWMIFLLTQRYITALSADAQLECFYAMLALFPVIVISLFVMLMMQLGFPYTGAILLPFASTFTLLIVVMMEKNEDFIQVRGRLPFSIPGQTEQQIVSIYKAFSDGRKNLLDTRMEMEKTLIESALRRSNNNITLAAGMLGVRRSTLYSAIVRLDINRQEVGE